MREAWLACALLLAACSSAAPGDRASALATTLAASPSLSLTQPVAPGVPSSTPSVSTPVPSPTFGGARPTAPAGRGLPDIPGDLLGFILDPISARFADEHRSIADDYPRNVFERPFSADSMDYLPYVDVGRVEISQSGGWIYVSISLQAAPPASALVLYAIELDLARQGRGMWLITADPPKASAWTGLGVRVYQDRDGDVGGPHPMAQDPPGSSNGYETLAYGDRAESPLAWARSAPGNPATIQIAFSADLLAGADRFLWSVWADAGPRQPGWFDYQDHFSLDEAGSPLANSPAYPLQGLAAVDNTCRWVFGFTPTGAEPGVCRFELPTPSPSRTPTRTPSPTP